MNSFTYVLLPVYLVLFLANIDSSILNRTIVLQQIHTYFISSLPRPYDRIVVSNTFALDLGILDKNLEFAPGEWLLSSYCNHNKGITI